MAIVRALAIHKHQSGLPRDHVVNTFHFETSDTGSTNLEVIAEMVRDFWEAVPSGLTDPLSNYFSDVIANTGHEVRMYPLDEATGVQLAGEGADPDWTEVFDHLGRVGTAQGGLPSEVAACLSYKAATPGGVPARRRRGRVFLGPWRLDVLAEEGTTERPYIPAGVRNQLIACGQDLRDAAIANSSPWVVYSRPFAGRFGAVKDNGDPKPDLPARPGAAYNITDLWVDDAWDTVRKRGERAVVRTTG